MFAISHTCFLFRTHVEGGGARTCFIYLFEDRTSAKLDTGPEPPRSLLLSVQDFESSVQVLSPRSKILSPRSKILSPRSL